MSQDDAQCCSDTLRYERSNWKDSKKVDLNLASERVTNVTLPSTKRPRQVLASPFISRC